jgi:hypothetical protein
MNIYWIGKKCIPKPYQKDVHSMKGSRFMYWITDSGPVIIVFSDKADGEKSQLEVANLIFKHGINREDDYFPDISGIINMHENNPRIVEWMIKEELLPTAYRNRKEISDAIGAREGGIEMYS